VALLLISPIGQAASCTGLRGTWKITYTIEDTFTDKVIIKTVNSSGAISGRTGTGLPVNGFCRNNTIYLTEKYANDLLNSWYFTTVVPRFARYVPVTTVGHDYDRVWIPATARKVSSQTLIPAIAEDHAQIRANKIQQLEEYFRKH
jgi:hypothetical protein